MQVGFLDALCYNDIKQDTQMHKTLALSTLLASLLGNLPAQDSHTYPAHHFYAIAADHSTLENLSLSPAAPLPPHDDELHQHLKQWSASTKQENTLGLGSAHKKHDRMQDYADYISKPSVFYDRRILRSRDHPNVP